MSFLITSDFSYQIYFLKYERQEYNKQISYKNAS